MPADGAAALRAADPVLAAVIDAVGPAVVSDPRRGYPRDHYGALLRAILGQQVSVAAAAAMYARLLDRYGGRTPTPDEVLAEDPETLRAAGGLSRAKLASLRSLAEHIRDGALEVERFAQLSDAEILAALVAVKGIGPWTAQVYLMFGLERPDVLAPGDLGIRRAVMRAYELSEMPDPADVEARAEAWRPHRTLACRYLWASLRATPV